MPLPSPESLHLPELSDSDVRTQYSGQVRMEGMDYLTPVAEAPNLTYSQLLTARFNYLREDAHFDFATDVAAATFFSRQQSKLFVNETYVSYKAAAVKASLGRKKEEWSELDHRWQLGLWQPRQAVDTLRPEEQGLVGVFLDHSTDDFQVLAFGSPIAIPSMGPDIREENGSLVSDSRWYRVPSQYTFNNRVNSISYSLDVPEAERLAMNAGGAMMVRVGSKSKGPWSVLSAGYKPVNDLILKRQVFKAISEDKVDVKVSPDVTHHAIGSLDVGYSFESVKVSASYLEDRPDIKKPDPEWAIQELLPIKAYSAAIDFFWDDILSRSLGLQLSYLKIEGGGIQDITHDGSNDDVTLFDQRMKFTNATAIQIETQIAQIFRRALVTRLRYLYDYDQRGSLLSTEFMYYPSQKWAVVVGADILGVQDEDYKPSSFLNQYRANDRVYGGMTYVF